MGLFDKIKSGLKKTRDVLTGRMDDLVGSYKELDDDFYEELSDILVMSDIGMETTQLAVNRLREKCTSEKIGDPEKARAAHASGKPHGADHRGGKRRWQNHHHRQTGLPLQGHRPKGDYLRRRYLPRRRRRSADRLGSAGGRAHCEA